MGFDDYKVVLYRQDDGSWVAEIPGLGGCYALMDTREAGLAELQHTFALIAQEHQDRGQALPKDTTEIVHASRDVARVSTRRWRLVSSGAARLAATNAGRTAIPLLSHCMVDGKSARRCSSRSFDNSMCRWRHSIGCADNPNGPLAYTIGACSFGGYVAIDLSFATLEVKKR